MVFFLSEEKMATILNWRGKPIEVAVSKGGVYAVMDYSANLIVPENIPWPPPEIVQKLYQSRQSRAFTGEDLRTAERNLGYYSDLQSIHSEDALTWSIFGTLKYSPLSYRLSFMDELLALVGFRSHKMESILIDLWRRIPHPDKLVPGGPEIDVVLQSEKVVVYCEAKWMSKVSGKQGKAEDKDQI
jgi:hypothetical protein